MTVRTATWRDFGALVVVQLHALVLVRVLRVVAIAATTLSVACVVALVLLASGAASVAIIAGAAALVLMALGVVVAMVAATLILTLVWLAWPAVRVFVFENAGHIEAMLTMRRTGRERIIAANHARRLRPRPRDAASQLRREVARMLAAEAERDGLTLALTAASASLVPLYLADIDGLVAIDDWQSRAGLRRHMRRIPSSSPTSER